MQRDVEVEFDSVDKSGGFIGTLYLNKTENAAITLAREGLATVHSFSAEGLPWVKQLYDAEVRWFLGRYGACQPIAMFIRSFFSGRSETGKTWCSFILLFWSNSLS